MTGRPSKFTQELANTICSEIMDGNSIRAICRGVERPSCTTVFNWLNEKPEFLEQYTRAREVQAEILADEIIEIADDSGNDKSIDDKGREIVDFDHINRSRLRVDARKWVAAKLLPKKYGDKQTIEHSGRVSGSLDLAGLDTETLRKLANAGSGK